MELELSQRSGTWFTFPKTGDIWLRFNADMYNTSSAERTICVDCDYNVYNKIIVAVIILFKTVHGNVQNIGGYQLCYTPQFKLKAMLTHVTIHFKCKLQFQ